MPQLIVITNDIAREISFTEGSSLRELLYEAGLRVRSGCLGNGACGLCLVRIEAGDAGEPTTNERLSLSPEQIGANIRLACQLMPKGDLSIRIIAASKTNWRDLTPGDLPCAPPPLKRPAGAKSIETAYGLAVDLGTTHISLSLWDLKQGRRLSGRIGLNPQSCCGSDVVTRLIAACESPDNARKIAGMPLDAVCEGLLDMCSREGFGLKDVVKVFIVGNTAMLALLTESDPRTLLQPGSWTLPVALRPDCPKGWAGVVGLHPEAAVEVVSPVAGFVGSDLLAGVVATRLTDQPGSLLIDFGTNSEMALWDGNTLWVTSAAGGPAFESCGMKSGMPAEPGAIYRVDRHEGSGELSFQVIGGGEPKGFCGSGLVDLVALLRSTGELKPTGKFASPYPEDGFVVKPEGPAIRLTKGDVDMFQRAKAAIGVGIKTLMGMARIGSADLRRVFVCGVFGTRLNTLNARLVGLLPDIPDERIELCGNTALAGCEHLLLSAEVKEELELLRERASIINLSSISDFEELFLENLYLQPLRVDET
ncbi:MAG: ASKHA domain-containing protein [Nitrospirota bacterium]